jgi:hypothetical protein
MTLCRLFGVSKKDVMLRRRIQGVSKKDVMLPRRIQGGEGLRLTPNIGGYNILVGDKRDDHNYLFIV